MKHYLAFLIIMLVVLLGSCKSPQAFDYRDMRNFRISNWGSDKANVSMDLVYFNPNSFGVNLKKVDCDIYVDSNYVGKFSLDTTMHIGRSMEFTLPARLEVDMKNLYKKSLNLLFGGEVLISAKGSTRVGKGGLYFTIPFTYSGKQQLNFR